VNFIDFSQLCSCVHSFSSSRDDASAERSTLSALAHVRGAWKSGILDPAPAPRSKQLPADRRSPSPFLTRAPTASCSLEFRDLKHCRTLHLRDAPLASRPESLADAVSIHKQADYRLSPISRCVQVVRKRRGGMTIIAAISR